MIKIIVIHFNPDLDAIGAVWLWKKFNDDYKEAELVFVPAGNTYQNQKVDNNEDIIHLDTGLGKFDHHQLSNKTCATELVFNYLKSKNKQLKNDKALIRLIKVINQIDNFEECLWPKPSADYFNFNLPEILRGLRASMGADDKALLGFGLRCLDGVYNSLKIKINAEDELTKGYKFTTQWGKAIGCLTQNDEVLKLGQKLGFILVVQKDPRTEHLRIKARPDKKIDLTVVKNKLKKLDPKASWYLHISKRMLLNGSSKNPLVVPSKLSLKKTIEVLKT